MKINTDFLKSLRQEKGWSQEQLATVTGLSLRTIQRIEADGSCSLESRNALASVFELHGADLEKGLVSPDQQAGALLGLRYAKYGIIIGLAAATIGVAVDFFVGDLSAKYFGVALGVLGAVTGATFALLGTITQWLRLKNKIPSKQTSDM
ncbi:MAG: helix-turn-helix transcriptional regulator [Gammaproteobacteria bacterium]|nr:helix-turn-helix transcriptional regulator [Gammaproteobacteria bacterium]